MAHWIDNADSYICPVCRFEVSNPNRHHGRCPKCGFMDEKDVLNADVVEVVRCKDCKFFHDKGYCTKITGLTRIKPDDFCSYGERKFYELQG